MHRPSSIVESRYARNYIPKLQAKFCVAEEEPDGPQLGPLKRLGNHAHTVTNTPPPGGFLMGVSLKQEATD